jgi:CDP-glycerol glycerophosphotransferase (TagB/SpsB family)
MMLYSKLNNKIYIILKIIFFVINLKLIINKNLNNIKVESKIINKKKFFNVKDKCNQSLKINFGNNFKVKKFQNQKKKKNFNIKDVISRLNRDYLLRRPKYIILYDYYNNPYCNDINAYLIFKYFCNKNITDAYYVINSKSDLYKSLLKKNETQNLIIINPSDNFYRKLYPYILNSKIIVNSFIHFHLHKIINNVKYLKYLYITHAIGYFKRKIIKREFRYLNINKRNIIVSSPYEYEIYKNINKYNDNYMYKAGLPRYERFNSFKRNNSENNCILISFTYRKYNNIIYNKSLLKKNIEKLLNDKSLIFFLRKRNIDLIYIQHHFDFLRKRIFNQKDFPYVKYKNQTFLFHYIQQCSLLVTDFSTISFDFMFLNKPTIFYLIDVNDKRYFEEKEYMKYNKNNNIYFGNVFSEQKLLL